MSQDHRTAQLGLLMQMARLGRTDAYAERRIINGKKSYLPVRTSITPAVIEAHYDSKQPIGIYTTTGCNTNVAVFDIDDHDGVLEPHAVLRAASRLADCMREYGLAPLLYRSGGGKGVHLWAIWPEPQSARQVRQLMRIIAAKCDLRDGAAGLAEGEVEIFPKQDFVPDGGLGNLVALPLALRSAALTPDASSEIARTSYQPPSDAALWSAPLPADDAKGEQPKEITPHIAPLDGDEEEVVLALRHISADDYDRWVKVALIVKQAFGEAGFEIWRAWSQTSAKYESAEVCRAKWNGLQPDGRIGIGSLFRWANEDGWIGPANQAIREMNARFGIWTHGRNVMIIAKNGDRRKDDAFPWLGERAFHVRLTGEFVQVPGPNGPINVRKSQHWFDHAKAARYNRVDFDPSAPPGHHGKTWNTWTGFAVEPVPGDWSLLRDHIRVGVAAGDDQIAEWLLSWMALGVQKPGVPIGTAPVLLGAPGTGKSFLARQYAKLWGPHAITVTHTEHVTGRFSGHLFNRRFVFIDEGMFGGDRRAAGTIKTRITESEVVFEQKGIDPVRMKNRMIFMIASNEDHVVPADIADRRWMILEVSDKFREDHQHFAKIEEQMENGGTEAMLYDLLRRDISKGPDPRRTIKTAGLFNQVRDVRLLFLHRMLDEGCLPQNYIAGPASTTIAALYSEFCREHPSAAWIAQNALSKFIGDVIPGITRRQGGWYVERYVGDRQIGKRSTQLNFPRLAECRHAFEHYARMPIPWTDATAEWRAGREGEEEVL